MSPALVILLLCAGSLLAFPKDGEGGPISCPTKKTSREREEMRRFIVWYHNRYRESNQKVVTYDCDLEKKAYRVLKDGKIDESKLKKYDGNDFEDEIEKGMKVKDYLDKAMSGWYEYGEEHYRMSRADTNRVGCAYKRSSDIFYFVCVYDQLAVYLLDFAIVHIL
ncbi:SCP-like protein [Ancylostoma duodenale]|uniref:SCP-like protein n=1 Tax=Ancylostoma duodenale TaxID=51022 RepID=A0A0C2GMN4_9BILA|nr:SCP-like protein [Ancylostoma duodenale]